MYGMINQALQEMICATHGTDAWLAIVAEAGADRLDFVALDPYPDELTYTLVIGASKVLGVSSDGLLRAFGQHWIVHTAQRGYGDLLRLTGRSLPEFLLNLDNLHARIGLSFPELRPPSFQCTEVSERRLLLHYYSARTGLEPMILGLLDGLGVLFGVGVRADLVESRSQGHDHEVFLVQLSPA